MADRHPSHPPLTVIVHIRRDASSGWPCDGRGDKCTSARGKAWMSPTSTPASPPHGRQRGTRCPLLPSSSLASCPASATMEQGVSRCEFVSGGSEAIGVCRRRWQRRCSNQHKHSDFSKSVQLPCCDAQRTQACRWHRGGTGCDRALRAKPTDVVLGPNSCTGKQPGCLEWSMSSGPSVIRSMTTACSGGSTSARGWLPGGERESVEPSATPMPAPIAALAPPAHRPKELLSVVVARPHDLAHCKVRQRKICCLHSCSGRRAPRAPRAATLSPGCRRTTGVVQGFWYVRRWQGKPLGGAGEAEKNCAPARKPATKNPCELPPKLPRIKFSGPWRLTSHSFFT